MNIYTHMRDRVVAALGAMADAGELPAGLDTSRVGVEPPREAAHGDLATNAAMVLAKPAGKKPRDIAEGLAARLGELDEVAAIEVAGPGFINLRLTPDFVRARVVDVLTAGADYGRSDVGQGRAVNVEYVSANPTGPLHAAHGRGAVIGDALASILDFAGFAVTREYYINDAGAQVDTLAQSAYLRYREACGEDIGEIPAGLYPGDYMVPVGEALKAKHGEALMMADEADWLPEVRATAIAAMVELIRRDLRHLGIEHDVFASERELVEDGAVDRAFAALDGAGLIYTGVLEPPKGKPPEDWEPRPQTLFKATEFGDDTDRPLKKSDGSWTYFASDIAYHLDKYQRGARDLINVWGADHGGYVKRMTAAVNAITGGEATLDIKLCAMVRLLDGGEPVRMSKRAGNFVTLEQVIQAVGRGAVRFMMLTRRNDQPMDFDFQKVRDQSRDNPVFYVQYAHARISSVLRNAEAEFGHIDLAPAALAEADLSPLDDTDELSLILRLASWPRLVEGAATAHEPHRVAFYLYDLASDFHALWNKGKDATHLRFLVEGDDRKTRARLAMVSGVRTVLALGLSIMGVEALEEM